MTAQTETAATYTQGVVHPEWCTAANPALRVDDYDNWHRGVTQHADTSAWQQMTIRIGLVQHHPTREGQRPAEVELTMVDPESFGMRNAAHVIMTLAELEALEAAIIRVKENLEWVLVGRAEFEAEEEAERAARNK